MAQVTTLDSEALRPATRLVTLNCLANESITTIAPFADTLERLTSYVWDFVPGIQTKELNRLGFVQVDSRTGARGVELMCVGCCDRASSFEQQATEKKREREKETKRKLKFTVKKRKQRHIYR